MVDEKDSCWLKPSCVGEYACRPINKPLDHESLSPFVILKLGEDGNQLTVGNESYPYRPNTAIIKSMEWGYLNESRAVFEILDEAGGELDLFVRSMKEAGCATQNFTAGGFYAKFKFGWVRSDCGSSVDSGVVTFGGWIDIFIRDIDVSYAGGLTKYIVTGDSVASQTDMQRQNEIEGNGGVENGNGMRLVDAISRICASKRIVPVWAMHDAQGKVIEKEDDVPDEWEWEEFGKEGPRGNWQGDNKDVLSVISTWLEPFRVKHGEYGAGITLQMDSKRPNRLYIYKDPRIEKVGCGDPNNPKYLGTFIVNGARCSPVIRFEPKFNFLSVQAGMNTGGVAGGSSNSKGAVTGEAEDKTPPICDQPDESAGTQLEGAITDSAKVNYPPNRVHLETMKSLAAHTKANLKNEFNTAGIAGELVLMGMPYDKYVDQTLFTSATLSIVVINTFHLRGDRNSRCGDWSWLAESGCNAFLSDREYFVQGVNHSIREGSFTTTLKVQNVNIQKGADVVE